MNSRVASNCRSTSRSCCPPCCPFSTFESDFSCCRTITQLSNSISSLHSEIYSIQKEVFSAYPLFYTHVLIFQSFQVFFPSWNKDFMFIFVQNMHYRFSKPDIETLLQLMHNSSVPARLDKRSALVRTVCKRQQSPLITKWHAARYSEYP